MFWEGESAGIMPVRGNHGGFLIYSTTPFDSSQKPFVAFGNVPETDLQAEKCPAPQRQTPSD